MLMKVLLILSYYVTTTLKTIVFIGIFVFSAPYYIATTLLDYLTTFWFASLLHILFLVVHPLALIVE